ncbi:MAG: AAA family ATPase [Spirochaetia bacterium]|nr:AAA family ATPase [Spirochaetia bacterium]
MTTLTQGFSEPKLNLSSKKYWLYAPGRNAVLWDEFYNQGIMGLGWDNLGDLNDYSSKEEITIKLQELSDSTVNPYNNASANYEFKEAVAIGDIVIAKKGRSELIGYGIITSDYFYDNSRSSYQKCRKIDWKKKGSWKTGFSLPLKTLTDVTKYTTEHPDYEFYYERVMGIMDANEEYQLKFPLNSIFYGPLGTGKTYNTILRSAQIIENRMIDNFSEAQGIFNENLGEQIEFITFHQNYSYEDFIQGIRPDVESGNNLTFEKKDGVFTRIAVNALFEYYKEHRKLNQTTTSSGKSDENEIYLDFIENIKSRENKEYSTIGGFKVFVNNINNNGNIEFTYNNRSRRYTVSSKRLLKLFASYKDISEIKNLNKDIRGIIGGCDCSIYWVALKEFIEFYNNYESVPAEDIQDEFEEVGYKTKKKLLSTVDLNDLRKVSKKSVKKYVIIIDEINRANISRVFGELITLIEPDKRSHGHIPLTCTLPAGDSFLIPSNLYIIGTMNTADKSIALLDIALRRRFEFISMYPLYEIEGQEIFDVDILQKINKQIKEKKGYDFQIGHSYFMGDNMDLNERMNNKVIPLLLEYFMNDEKEVKGILSSAGLTVKPDSWPLEIDREA